VATAGDDIPELVAELRLRNDRIRRLEADLAASRRTPAMVADVIARAEAAARAKLADLRTALGADLPAMREVFQALFPEGLTFRPATSTPRRVWVITGTARLDSLKFSSDPSGSLSNLRLAIPLSVVGVAGSVSRARRGAAKARLIGSRTHACPHRRLSVPVAGGC
jgi:hypothetical protein